MKKTLSYLVLFIILGCTSIPVKINHMPRFKVGDCIMSYGSFDNKIQNVYEKYYTVLIGSDCKLDGYKANGNQCCVFAHDIEIVDKNSVKIECPNN